MNAWMFIFLWFVVESMMALMLASSTNVHDDITNTMSLEMLENYVELNGFPSDYSHG